MSPRTAGTCVAVLATLVFAEAAEAQRRDEGVRQVQRLVGAAEDTVQAIGETRERLVRTMEIYNSLMADDAETVRWWKETDPCQIPFENRSEGQHWKSMEEVYHLD